MEQLISALPAAASSPFAFVAYLLLVAVFAYLAVAQHRLKSITRVIESIPENKRFELLKKEYNVIPKEGLAASDWILARRNAYFFWAFISVAAVILIVVVIALQQKT